MLNNLHDKLLQTINMQSNFKMYNTFEKENWLECP